MASRREESTERQGARQAEAVAAGRGRKWRRTEQYVGDRLDEVSKATRLSPGRRLQDR